MLNAGREIGFSSLNPVVACSGKFAKVVSAVNNRTISESGLAALSENTVSRLTFPGKGVALIVSFDSEIRVRSARLLPENRGSRELLGSWLEGVAGVLLVERGEISVTMGVVVGLADGSCSELDRNSSETVGR